MTTGSSISRRRTLAAAITLAVLCAVQGAPLLSKARHAIGDYRLVRITRVTANVTEFVYRATLHNHGPALPGATATLVGPAKDTTIVDRTLTFGPVRAGGRVESVDTFTIRHHRRQPFPHRLASFRWDRFPEFRWEIATAAAANRAPVANAGVDRTVTGRTPVTLDGRTSSDPDGDRLNFQWTLLPPIGSTATLSSGTTATPAFTPDVRGRYEARLVVDDGRLASAVDAVVVTVGSMPPVANAGLDAQARVAQATRLNGSDSRDADGDALSFRWRLSTRPAGSTSALTDAEGATPTLIPDVAGSYVAELTVSDGTSSSIDTVTVTAVNTAPVANAGPDQTANVGATVALNGTASIDADGDLLSYRWRLQSAPTGAVPSLVGATSVSPTLSIPAAGLYVVQLVVNDGRVDSALDTVVISTANSAPVANAGADRTTTVAATVTLDGGASTDVDGDSLTFRWRLVAAPAGSVETLRSATSVAPTFRIDRPGTYRFELVVSDSAASSAPDAVVVTTVNSAPVANAGPDQTAYAPQTVTLDGSASTDVDGDALNYHWSLTSAPAGSRARLSDAGAIRPSFAVDRAGTYVAQLLVNDGLVSGAVDTVTVTTLNTAPVASAGPDQSVVAGQIIGLTGEASADVNGDGLAYAWAITVRPSGSTAPLLDPTSVMPTFRADRVGTYVLQLIVNDGTTDSAPDTVTISTSNTAPVASAGADQPASAVNQPVWLDGSASLDADGHGLTYRWALIAAPAGSAATISDAGAIGPAFTPDRGGQYVAQLIVSDGFVDSAPDTVVIETVNRAPVANAGADLLANVGTPTAVSADGSTDPDGDALTYAWALTARPGGSVASLTSAATATPTFTPDVVGAYTLQLTATDGAGLSSTDLVTVNAVVPASVTIQVTDGRSTETPGDTGLVTVMRAGATTLPLTVSYQLSGSAASGDDYAALSGSVTIPAGQASATIVVTPADDADFEGTETMTITAVNGPGYLVGSPNNGSVQIIDNDQPTVTIVATDADASEAGPDEGAFTVSRTGITSSSLTVSFTARGTATNGVDYVNVGTTVVIPAGASSATITVTPRADGAVEGQEAVDITIAAGAYAIGSPATATVRIAASN
jgi:hypothetical protein